MSPAEQVEAFLAKKRAEGRRFRCPKLGADIDESECVTRQQRPVRLAKSNGYTYQPEAWKRPLDDYCRSGVCPLGLTILKRQGQSSARRERAQELDS